MTTLSSHVKVEIKWTTDEIEDLIFGSGALSYPWWTECKQIKQGHYRITAVDPDYPDDEDAQITLIFPASLFTYAIGVVASTYPWHAQTIIDRDLDADLVDMALQTVVHGEVVYG